MKEYRILVQHGNSKPYSLHIFDDFNECYLYLLYLIEEQQKHLNKKYYVSNSFFKNKYPAYTDGIVLYTIQVREVESWVEYKEVKKSKNLYSSNILPF